MEAFYSITSVNIIANEIFTNPPPVSKISIKYDNIFWRDTSSQIHKSIEYYSLLAIDNIISLSSIINYTFIIVSDKSSIRVKKDKL